MPATLHRETASSSSEPAPPLRQILQGLTVFAITAAYLFLNVFASFRVPFLFAGDQVFFWTDAQRILDRQLPYRDFFQFTSPGTDYFFAALFRIFGTHIWVTDFAIILVGCALAWACFEAASQLLSPLHAALATAIFVVFVYGRILDATHHWFSLLAIVCALRCLMPQRSTARTLAAGALLGIACCFTQTTGVSALIGISIVLVWETGHLTGNLQASIKPICLLVIAFASIWLVLNIYFLYRVSWATLWYSWIFYASRFSGASPSLLKEAVGRNHPSISTALQRLGILATLVVVYPVSLWRLVRSHPDNFSSTKTKVLFLAVPGALLFAEMMIRPSWVRIYMVALPAIVLFIWLAAVWLITAERNVARYAVIMAWALVLAAGLEQIVSVHRQLRPTLQFPAGAAAVVDQRYVPEYQWVLSHTRPGDNIQAVLLNMYLSSSLRDPLYLDGLWRGENMRSLYVSLSIEQMKASQVKYIMWAPQLFGDMSITSDNLGPIRAFILQNYTRIQIFPSGNEVWQLRSS